MKQEVLANFNIPWIPISGLFIFLIIFIAAVIWIFRDSAESVYKEAEKIPFNEGEPYGR